MYYLMEQGNPEHCQASKYYWDIKLVELFQIFSEAEQADLHQKSQYCSLRMIQGSSCPVPCGFTLHFQAEVPLKMLPGHQDPWQL